jgi:chemotaxis-related protein WspD
VSEPDIKSGVPEPQPLQTRAGLPAAEIHDCWNRIGVDGDGSCPELDQYVHCRNCPAYARAGTQFLNRLLPADYRQEWTEYLAEKRKPTAGSRMSVVVFRLGGEWLALPARDFQEVTDQRTIHSIPHRNQGVALGLVNVRGELLVCISLARLLGLDHSTPLEKLRSYYGRLLVFVRGGSRLTFPADEVHGIHRLHPDEITRPPKLSAKAEPTFTQGMFNCQPMMVGLLDPDPLFSTLNRSLA